MSIKDDLNKYTPRKEQKSAHDFIFNVIKENPKKKFFLLNLPTGIGKSHLAMMISNTYMTKINTNSKVDIIKAGKILQDQYSESHTGVSRDGGMQDWRNSLAAAQGETTRLFSSLVGPAAETHLDPKNRASAPALARR